MVTLMEISHFVCDDCLTLCFSLSRPCKRNEPGLLELLELGMALDGETCRKYPLLLEYHPLFSPELLEYHQLTTYRDMLRAQQIVNI
jgi:hypothetical protein